MSAKSKKTKEKQMFIINKIHHLLSYLLLFIDSVLKLCVECCWVRQQALIAFIGCATKVARVVSGGKDAAKLNTLILVCGL